MCIFDSKINHRKSGGAKPQPHIMQCTRGLVTDAGQQ